MSLGIASVVVIEISLAFVLRSAAILRAVDRRSRYRTNRYTGNGADGAMVPSGYAIAGQSTDCSADDSTANPAIAGRDAAAAIRQPCIGPRL